MGELHSADRSTETKATEALPEPDVRDGGDLHAEPVEPEDAPDDFHDTAAPADEQPEIRADDDVPDEVGAEDDGIEGPDEAHEPAEPQEFWEPEEPAEPAEPKESWEPEEPAEPAEPKESWEQGEPDQPAGPAEPEEFQEPGEPEEFQRFAELSDSEEPADPGESGELENLRNPDSVEPADRSGASGEPEQPHARGASDVLADAAEERSGDEQQDTVSGAADDGPPPEGAPLGDIYSKLRDAVLTPREPAEGSLDLYATVDRPAYNAVEIPEYGVRLYQYGTPLDRSDGGRIPLFDGPPAREQTMQGSLGDCGVIATMGAVAGHLPEAISNAVKENADGTYEVTFHQVKKTAPGDWTPYEPTGSLTVLTVTPDLVVKYDDTQRPAYAKVQGGAAWPAILEKAFAGVDQTWEEGKLGDASGYQRLNLGTKADNRAVMLAQLTGRPAYTEDVPSQYDMNGVSPDRQLLAAFREKLDANCPILMGTKDVKSTEEPLGHDLVAAHVYEVTGVDDRGRIHLRNPHNKNQPEPLTARQFRDISAGRYTTIG
ncbi:C2 family cysteine protease [Streptomyces sp. NPDC096136]|uniref:C2 family cysteine protease n=1 Tax=Streptomyces sp. NPDC096136 TaxID=3366076 RepID=UPI00380B43BB